MKPDDAFLLQYRHLFERDPPLSLERAADEICRLTGRDIPISRLQRFRAALGVTASGKRQRSRFPITADIVEDWIRRHETGEETAEIAGRWPEFSPSTIRTAIYRVITERPETEAECLVNQARIQARGQQNP